MNSMILHTLLSHSHGFLGGTAAPAALPGPPSSAVPCAPFWPYADGGLDKHPMCDVAPPGMLPHEAPSPEQDISLGEPWEKFEEWGRERVRGSLLSSSSSTVVLPLLQEAVRPCTAVPPYSCCSMRACATVCV